MTDDKNMPATTKPQPAQTIERKKLCQSCNGSGNGSSRPADGALVSWRRCMTCRGSGSVWTRA